MLDVQNLNSFYGRSKAIQDLSIKVLDGAVFAILGRNGVGKTTLLRTILGLTDKCEGSIKLNGTKIEFNHKRFFRLSIEFQYWIH